jgi:hypothetical protein
MRDDDFLEENKNEYNPIDDIADKLNFCRLDYHKLYKKDFKVASIRLRQNLEFVIQTAKQMKRDALKYRKEIEERERIAKEEAKQYFEDKENKENN